MHVGRTESWYCFRDPALFSAIAGSWSSKVKTGATSQDSGKVTPSDSSNVASEVRRRHGFVCVDVCHLSKCHLLAISVGVCVKSFAHIQASRVETGPLGSEAFCSKLCGMCCAKYFWDSHEVFLFFLSCWAFNIAGTSWSEVSDKNELNFHLNTVPAVNLRCLCGGLPQR